MNLGFVVHYVLAGLFTYWFLRRWRVSWTGAVVGGLAYELAGVIGSYVSPGHDGKLFVTAMLPLTLAGLTIGIRDRRLEGYAIVALAVGLMMLSPHPQMAQYALLAAGLFTLYLALGDRSVTTPKARVTLLALAAAAVVVGVGVSAIQYVPFYAYIPYSPRDSSVLHNFEWSAAYAIPWAHVPELVIPRFTGETFNGSYWGPNGLKLHSEYLGLAGRRPRRRRRGGQQRRRMIVWLGGIGLLFLFIALGASTPFFRLWWEIVPFSKSMRAPGMALFIVAFVMAVFVGVRGRPRGERHGAAIRARSTHRRRARRAAWPDGSVRRDRRIVRSRGRGEARASAAWGDGSAAAGTIQWSALVGRADAGGCRRDRASHSAALSRPRIFAGVLIALVGTDLWLNDRAFWNYSNAPDELFSGDAIKTRLRSLPRPFRVWDVDVVPRRGAHGR